MSLAMTNARMRKVNTRDFRRATRRTSRAVNSQIVLNLIREHQPISRADLARRMRVRRGVISVLVGDLLGQGAVYEGTPNATARGRRPAPLYVRTADRLAAAVDVRVERTHVMLANFGGRPLAVESLATPADAGELIALVAARVRQMVADHALSGTCEGVGLVVPGAVDWRTGRVLHAPHLGWRELDVRDALAEQVGLPVHVESAPVACALAQLWFDRTGGDNFVYVTVSNGVGAGVVVNGEVVRGHGHTIGEFGHVPLDLDGPPCVCGARGCWEAYVSNRALLQRYEAGSPGGAVGGDAGPPPAVTTVEQVVALAGAGDARALAALDETAHYIGVGLSVVVNALSPARVYVAGEIAGAWPLIEARVRASLAGRALTAAGAATPVVVAADAIPPRLRGAAALVAAPMFAAPRVG